MRKSCLLLAIALLACAPLKSAAEQAPLPLPAISSFWPLSGYPGTTVELTGTNFFGVVAVRFNGVETKWQADMFGSSTSLWTIVPDLATTGPITMETAAGITTSATDFVVVTPPLPKITGFSPDTAYPGQTLYVNGENLVDVTDVSINGQPMTSYMWFPFGTQIMAGLPGNATSGYVTVTTKWGRAVSPDPFPILTRDLTPRIDSLSPDSGYPGAWLMVNGQNFEQIVAVKVNGVAAVYTVLAGPVTLNVRIPDAATSGPLTVETPYGTATSPTPVTVLSKPPPVISSLWPNPIRMGAQLFIYGQSLDQAQAVFFNGVASDEIYPGPELLLAKVPFGASNGPVTVSTPSGMAVSADNLQVIPTADLVLSQTVSRSLTAVGHKLTYSLSVTNLGPSPLSGVVLTNALVVGNKRLRPDLLFDGPSNDPVQVDIPEASEPESFELISATTTLGQLTTTNGALVCDLGTLQAGAGAALELVVQPLKPGRLIQVSAVRTADADLQLTNNFGLSWIDVVEPTELLVRQLSPHALEISWSGDSTEFVLETSSQTPTDASPSWSDVPATPTLEDGWWRVSVPLDASSRLYRLVQRSDSGTVTP